MTIALTPTGWQSLLGGALPPAYASGTLGDNLATTKILNGVATSSLKGASFCVGYGSNASEMTSAMRLRPVATVGSPMGSCAPALPADPKMRADCVFNWAESTYAGFFAPSGTASQTASSFYLRFYAATNAYLGMNADSTRLYYLGNLSNNNLLDLGDSAQWFAAAACR